MDQDRYISFITSLNTNKQPDDEELKLFESDHIFDTISVKFYLCRIFKYLDHHVMHFSWENYVCASIYMLRSRIPIYT